MVIVKRIFTSVIVILLAVALAQAVSAEEPAKIDLNKATVDELVKLKGIGQTYAERIVEYREANGVFKRVEDIMNVKGIGAKKFESIKDLVMVELPKKK